MSGCHEVISCNTSLSTPHPAVLYCEGIGRGLHVQETPNPQDARENERITTPASTFLDRGRWDHLPPPTPSDLPMN